MIVVSNTSPILNLAVIGQLDLLQMLYDRVTVPQAVYDEIVVQGTDLPGAVEVKAASWIEARQPSDRGVVASLELELDRGEAEAIALAVELNADLLLLDEREGRAIASCFNPKFIGLLGVLTETKRKGFIPALKPVMDDLIRKAGFWISKDLYDVVLRSVGDL